MFLLVNRSQKWSLIPEQKMNQVKINQSSKIIVSRRPKSPCTEARVPPRGSPPHAGAACCNSPPREPSHQDMGYCWYLKIWSDITCTCVSCVYRYIYICIYIMCIYIYAYIHIYIYTLLYICQIQNLNVQCSYTTLSHQGQNTTGSCSWHLLI